ncbi:hypothetical protein, partial [Agathobaculum sp.]|uniref:hypothetical protein n=1 Tax=Agathobaculum sp. TaxID=2048138 RepID=UPI003FD7582A
GGLENRLSERARGFESHPFRHLWNRVSLGFERRLLAACRWHIATAVDFPQKMNPTRSAIYFG